MVCVIIVFLKGVIKQKTLPYLSEHSESVEATYQVGRRGLVGEGRQRGKNKKNLRKMKKIIE